MTAVRDPLAPVAREVTTAVPARMRSLRALDRETVARVWESLAQAAPLACYRILRLGPAGIAGLAATLAAAAISLTALVTVRSATDALTLRLERAQLHPNLETSTELGIARVMGELPTRGQIPAVIGLMLREARAAGVALDTGHYVYTPSKAGGVARYELEFPVKAGYVGVRDFINRTLTAVPAASLEKLHIERKGIGDTVVNADVRFVVFVRSGQEP